MEDSFSVRVDKTFGSLSDNKPTINPSLWSLTDQELHCPRQPDHPISDDEVDEEELKTLPKDAPFSTNVNHYDDEDEGDGAELDEEAGEGTSGKSQDRAVSNPGGEEGGEDELDVRSSIGLDPTLDFEEEEDQYDKVAVGTEQTTDRLYVSHVTDYTSHDEICNELPTTFKEASRDPRANHLAAKLRLKEDAEAAKSFNSLHVSDQNLPVVSGDQSDNDGNNLKSILKRKEDQMDSKSEKRVRFDSSCKNNDGGEFEADKNVTSEDSIEENTMHGGSSFGPHDSSLVPDYIRNPSKYTHYTFDSSSDMNEECNRQAYAEFLSVLKKSKQLEPDESPADLSKPVIFNPKKKAASDAMENSSGTDHSKEVTMEEPVHRKSFNISVAMNEQEDQASEMEVDEQATATRTVGNEKKPARRYRSKHSLGSNESYS